MSIFSNEFSPTRPWSPDDEECLSDLFSGPCPSDHVSSEKAPDCSIRGLPSVEIQLTDEEIQLTDEEKMLTVTDKPPSTKTMPNSTSSMDTANIASQLRHVLKQGRARRRRISIPTAALGFTCIVISFTMNYAWRVTLSVARDISYVVGWCMAAVGFFALLLSLLPSDKRAVLISAYITTGFLIIIFSSNLPTQINMYQDAGATGCVATTNNVEGDEDITCWIRWVMFGYSIFGAGMGYFLSIRLCNCFYRTWRKKARDSSLEILTCMWLCLCIICCTLASQSIFYAIIWAIFSNFAYFAQEASIATIYLSVGIVSYPRFGFRRYAQSWLASFSEGAVAAGVAELLGGQKAENVLVAAKDSFLYIRADRLVHAHMAQNTPNQDLIQSAQKARLGEIDAFVSHSWHDDGEAKWKALQSWREEFKNKNQGREPKLWIDKYCIDQNDIDGSLVCLPVYLAACKKLLVLAGKTYLRRLWCLVEIFVFLQMGGQPENLEVRILSENAEAGFEPTASLELIIESFNPEEARCENQYDTDRLQAVLEASEMGVQGMRDSVREIFLRSSVKS